MMRRERAKTVGKNDKRVDQAEKPSPTYKAQRMKD